ncbi:diguanylate cyclase [Shewanella hanedai]|uniref:EAL domain-containing protein n=1 Tax=Shewanella hanedai TaxID=25 RepID=A0A553JJP9_SHEHA|nr:EAL domain-containing protein [Shewanella hanedai]TRY12693.1 EAL domain-containing protein [Shewanella hanedai]GGI94235.1 diguanylate cyclase [Shewanella hanedai]
MESHDAGLLLVQFVREELNNMNVRIILRTGQPGYAPEMSVIKQYDINDYREKSDLTSNVIFSCLTTALRSYQQIKTIESSRKGLEMVVDASSALLTIRGIKQFSIGILTHICALLHIKPEGIICANSKETELGKEVTILAAAGHYSHLFNQPITTIGKPHIEKNIENVILQKKSIFIQGFSFIYIPTTASNEIIVIIESSNTVSALDQQLVKVFGINIAVGFNNASMFEHIEDLAYTDKLTNLPNRISLMKHLSERMLEKENPFFLVIIDIDDFNVINDGLGSTIGDRVIVLISTLLSSIEIENKYIACLGKGTFGLIFGLKDNQQISRTLLEVQHVLKPKVSIDNNNILVSLSGGVNVFNQQDKDAELFFSNTSIALKRAKESYRGRFCLFCEEMNAQLTARLKTINELHTALDRNELFLLYQPQVDYKTLQVIGVEALVRWQKNDGTLVYPLDFIEAAEDSGLIVPIGLWILKTAIAQSLQWKSEGYNIRMAVNVSPRQMSEEDFVDKAIGVIKELGMTPKELELEITETTAVKNTDELIKKLTLLRHAGVQIAIDDFGTGYSSLSYLQKLPVDRLKIDGSFIRNIDTSEEDACIAEMIINMGHKLNLEVIAECVETNLQQKVLIELGCDEAQGYLYEKPIPGDALALMLKNQVSIFSK